MHLTTYTDYSLRVLIYLGLEPDRLATIQEISDQYEISRNHLMKVVHDLGRLGYVETIRGKHGGLRLGRAPEKINIGEVIRNMEPDMALVECLQPTQSHCRIVRECILKSVLCEALDNFLSTLDRYTLADLAVTADELSGLFPNDIRHHTPPDTNAH